MLVRLGTAVEPRIDANVSGLNANSARPAPRTVHCKHDVVISRAYADWRDAARALLLHDVPPENVSWHHRDDAQGMLLGMNVFEYASVDDTVSARVPRDFLQIAPAVACHNNPGRWDALYHVLYRLTHGEPSLLDVATDPDVHRITSMNRTVRREIHKMHAFVRFRAVEARDSEGGGDAASIRNRTTYVAWFEPEHHVVQRATPFFARRFPYMRWSILTPDECAHWDSETLSFTPGVSSASAPTHDELEELWRSYYANIFNPARVAVNTMQAEMPQRYWNNLPEARLIAGLAREAPRRVARMLTQTLQPAAEIPDELRSQIGVVTVPARMAVSSAVSSHLDVPGEWDVVHDPGVSVARSRVAMVNETSGTVIPHTRASAFAMHDTVVRVGTASWTDPTILHPGVFYPANITTPEARLHYYASRFPVVEVDATYYVLPTRAMAAAWAARTPQDFVFDIKAHALMTGQATEIKRMPDWLRRLLPRSVARAERVRAAELPRRIVDEVWRRFLSALAPLREAGKLGPILLQFPRSFVPSRENANLLRQARERLGDAAAAVEFRNPQWVEGRILPRTLSLLESLQLTYVIVDAPPATQSSMPPDAHVTTPGFSVVRLHGRRVSAWEARHDVVSERYRYLYDSQELSEWAGRIDRLAGRVASAATTFPDMAKAKQGVHVVFNNCHANYGTTNAVEITKMLVEFDKVRRYRID